MAKQVLKSLDLTTLLVALDHHDEYGPPAATPDPYADPAACVYLTYAGEQQAAALAQRLPHVEVLFITPGVGDRRKIVRKVFGKPAIEYVLRFSFAKSKEFLPFVRDLGRIDRKYWKVLDASGEPIPRPKPDKK